jgi:hypothetical protein
MSKSISDFLKRSVELLDDQDISREFSNVQMKYGKDLIQKDLEIKQLNETLENINSSIKKINTKVDDTKSKLRAVNNIKID